LRINKDAERRIRIEIIFISSFLLYSTEIK
jgi:hypothetical protein